MAKKYAASHLFTDPSTRAIYFLPTGSPKREIRFVEVNDSIVERFTSPQEPLNFGIDVNGESPFSLMVIDVTPSQWAQIEKQEIALPVGWSLENAHVFSRNDA